MTEAFPLQWPAGWPRTVARQQRDGRNDFGRMEQQGANRYRSKRPLTFAEARDGLIASARKVGARQPVISSNFALNSWGLPRGDRRRPEDQGVALYFTLADRPMVMARDAYTRAEENMRSLALALEAMAQLERHGGGVMLEKAFSGFAALEGPSAPRQRPWREVLGFSAGFPHDLDADEAEKLVSNRWRSKARDAHPDQGGSDDLMAELNAAKDAALKELKQ